MEKRSSPCIRLILANADRLPSHFLYRPGDPSYEGHQEVLWTAVLELIDHLLDGPPLPFQLSLPQSGSTITVDNQFWDDLQGELEIVQLHRREAVEAFLGMAMFSAAEVGHAAAQWTVPLAQQLSPRTLGFFLLVCHLYWINPGQPRDLGFSPGELIRAARHHPLASQIGRFDEVVTARALSDYAGLHARSRTEPVLRTAFQILGLPLRSRLSGRAWQPPTSGGETGALDPNLLLRGLPSVTPAQEDPPPVNEWSGADPGVLAELARLRAENEMLRGASVSALLAEVIRPLLALGEDPIGALENPRFDMVERSLTALRTFLRHPAVNLFGTPGQIVRATIPSEEYILDESVPPLKAPCVKGVYRVTRRGLRLNGRIILQAQVIPSSEATV